MYRQAKTECTLGPDYNEPSDLHNDRRTHPVFDEVAAGLRPRYHEHDTFFEEAPWILNNLIV
jgi:hypothetical protein